MTTPSQERPNVIVFLTGQQRWDTFGLHRNPLDLMPNFELMAQRGTHVFNSFTSYPLCSAGVLPNWMQSRGDAAIKKMIAFALPFWIFLLAACGTAGLASPGLGPLTSADKMLGAWHRTTGDIWYIAIHEDGTLNGGSYLDAVREGRGHDGWKYRFLGTQLILQGSIGHCEENTIGIFEVYLQENGNLKFFTIEDECASRAGQLAGRDGIIREYEPVP